VRLLVRKLMRLFVGEFLRLLVDKLLRPLVGEFVSS